MNYSKDKKMCNENMSDQSANAGENQTHFSGNTEGGRDEKIMDSAGVTDGLSSMEGISVKNAEGVCTNQRPKGNTEKVGTFTMGVS